ncbi:AMP-binding protein [Thalassomonas viridans]|uniref:AMP-binding protein n=1 Tax=Thalassomonas viridans TaxID=137584 RepID=A0AAF0CEJ2_9GAMM|nr:condensation domain-containing protein [Thalassomonas viridans]WDE09240.1 AMP-binding protein [Thalassomonas viridans]
MQHLEHPTLASGAQQRLVVMEQMHGPSSSYNMPVGIINIRGDLDIVCLNLAVKQLLQRHQTLTSSFTLDGGEFVVDYSGQLEVEIELVKQLQPLDDRERDAVIKRECRRVFTLSRAPLFHLSLLKRSEQRYTLLVAMHHIVTDGWSSGVIIADLVELYNGAYERRSPRLAPLPITFDAYVKEQQNWLQTPEFSRQQAFWRAELADYQGYIDLPGCYETRQEHPPQLAKGFLSPGLTQRVRRFCTENKVTPFVFLLSVFKLLVSRLSGQQDLVVGTPNAGREDPRLQNMVGYFINHLPLRSHVSPELSFAGFVRRLKQTTQQAIAHQDIPFEEVLKAVNPPRIADRTPLFNVYFNYQNELNPALDFSGAQIQSMTMTEVASNFDLTFYVHNSGSSLALSCAYKQALFSMAKMERLLASFQYLLEQVIAEPDASLAGYSIQQEAIRAAARPFAGQQEGAESVQSMIFKRPPQQMLSPAVIDAERVLSYQTLLDYSKYYGARLKVLAPDYSRPVVILAEKNCALVVAMLAVLLSGHTFVMMPSNLHPQRRSQQIGQVRPQVVLSAAGQVFSDPGIQVLALELQAKLALEGQGYQDEDFCWQTQARQPGYLSFTSGSEGEPKMVAATSDSWLRAFPWFNREFSLGAGDSASVLSGIGHDPLHRDILLTLCRGASVCLPREQDMSPFAMGSWLEENKIAVVNMTPSLAKLLLTGASGQIESVKQVFFGGEPLSAETAAGINALFPNARLTNLYGTTETQQSLCYYPIGEADLHKQAWIPAGRANIDTCLAVVDANGRPCGYDEIGEVVFSGPLLSSGYHNDARLTAQKYRALGTQTASYHTGDLGRIDSKGNLHLLGRNDRQVSVNGFRVELGEIEKILCQLPDVREAKVLWRRSRDTHELRAFVLGRSEGVREQLQRRLPDYCVPASIVRVTQWPLTANGKLDRRALLALPAEAAVPQQDVVAPQGEVETFLAQLWCEVLDCRQVCCRQNFYELGGQSLQLARITGEIHQKFNLEISFADFYEHASIQDLAALINNRKGHQSRETAPVQAAPGGKKAFFI